MHPPAIRRFSSRIDSVVRVRCITLNLEGLEHDWFRSRFGLVVAGLRKHQPDVVCFQESTICYADRIYNQAQLISDAAGLNSVGFAPYGNPTEIMSPNQGGVAIISRWAIRATRNRRLPTAHDTPPDARVALLVTFQTPAGALDVVNTHLSWQPVEGPLRLTQLGMVIDEFSSNEWISPLPRALLVGDFNATEQEPAIHLANERLKDAFRAVRNDDPGYTWVRSNPMNVDWRNMPDRRLDYIYCPRDVKVLRAELIFDGSDGVSHASDHFGLLADLEWPAERINHSISSRPRAHSNVKPLKKQHGSARTLLQDRAAEML
jgi:endonuclease/exonuclease/phosphatase family metal-dependent hydrolase